MDVNIVTSLISQAPGMAGVIIVVYFFLRAIEKRDQVFVDQMNRIVERLAALEQLITHHDAASRVAYQDRSDTLDRIEKKVNVMGDRQRKSAQP